MKKLLTMVACLALCICLLGVNAVMAADPTPDFIAAEEGIELEAGLSDAQTEWADFDLTLGSEWTISGEFATEHYEGAFYRQILVKGPKDAGHFEIYLQPDGYIAMYLPDGNGGGAANAGALDDGKTHAFCFVGKDGAITFYVDGAVAEGSVGAYSTFTAETEKFKLGDLVEGGMPYTGSIKGVRIFADTAVSDDLAKKLSTVGYKPAADEPAPAGDAAPALDSSLVYSASAGNNIGVWLKDATNELTTVFNVDKPFNEIKLDVFWASNPPANGTALYNFKISLYKFSYNVANTLAGTPVASAEIINGNGDNNKFYNDTPAFEIAGNNMTLSGADTGLKAVLGSDLPAGQYVLYIINDVGEGSYLVLPTGEGDLAPVKYLRGTAEGEPIKFALNTAGQFVDLIPDSDVPADAPQTGDATVVTFAVIAVVALAVVAFAKKRIAE